MTIRFTLTMSPDESFGIFPQATPSNPMSQEMYLSLRALPPQGRLHKDKKRKLSIELFFPKKEGVSQRTCETCGPPLTAKQTA